MKNFQKLFLTILTAAAFTLTGCLHIIEDVTFHDNGKGTYKMTLDMSEVKGMMEMMKGMAPADSTGEAGAVPDGSMGQMGQGLSDVAASLKGVQGITNVVETNDTTAFMFGYTFDFADAASLNRALKVINKDKFQSTTDEVFKFNGKTFERLGSGDIGSEMKKAMSESEAGDDAGGMDMDMIKNFFGDMTYKQVYHFPDREIKKSSNELGEVSEDKHSLTITLKPFDEEQAKKKVGVATEVKLK
jgi:hypothetical protein